MKYKDVVQGNFYRLTSATISLTYYRATNINTFIARTDSTNPGPDIVRPTFEDRLECIRRSTVSWDARYRVWRNGIKTDTVFGIESHAYIEPFLDTSDGNQRKIQADNIQKEIQNAQRKLAELNQQILLINENIGKLNARYQLLTNFDTDEAAVAHVLNEMKDATPAEIIDRLKLSGVQIIV